MRWALVRICLAVTVMVVAAFALPLGAAVQQMARDRAFTDAERQAATIGPVLSITTDRRQLEKAVASTGAGERGRLAVHVPRGPSDDGWALGAGRARPEEVADAVARGKLSRIEVPGGWAMLQPMALGTTGRPAVVEVFVPAAEVTRGVCRAWLVLAGIATALVAGSVVVADRLGLRTVRPAEHLARAAHDLGEGRLETRVAEAGPAELRSVAGAFNAMADQVTHLLAAERELAADLSHRLRTPLTVLRLNVASLDEGSSAESRATVEQTRAAVDHLEREVDAVIRTAREQRPAVGGPASESGGCDGADVLRERMVFWSALAEDEGRETRLSGVEGPVHLPVPRAELTAALDAMLGNIFRHTPLGTAFAVDVHQSDDSVIVLVSDAGDGIADPDAALRRGNDGTQHGSTGLGLDIVRRLARSTGGDVTVGRSVLGGAEIGLRMSRTPHRRGGRRHRGRGIQRRPSRFTHGGRDRTDRRHKRRAAN
ncbi:HAMP domain-containing sensor histidine kinase [Streptomyces sp. NPDC002506]|uniref:sensor histidine kinase n=1 Tax=Streptomyces sp. NPDC002506 TaxID=3154536 RepID=UPI003317FFF2